MVYLPPGGELLLYVCHPALMIMFFYCVYATYLRIIRAVFTDDTKFYVKHLKVQEV